MMMAQSDFEKGEQFFKLGKFIQAKPLFENCIKTNANDTKSIEYLGDIAGAQKKWDEAILYYKKLKTLFPKNANYCYKYGGALGMKAKESNKFKALGMIDEIENSFLTSAKLDPKHTDTRWALLILYLELPGIIGGSVKKSQKYANELMTISKIDGVMAKGHIEEHLERYKEAEILYKQGIEITHSKTAYQRLINLYKNKMKLPEKAKLAQIESDKYNNK
jgi:tetratricopeptide (TPR) repeat protein